MKLIPLGNDRFAKVDDADFERMSQYKWSSSGKTDQPYAKRGTKQNGKQFHFYMHRIIAEPPDGCCVDHIDGDTLNNQRSNLRICSHRENIRNGKHRTSNKSGFKGVSFIKAKAKFAAHIKVDGKSKFLGYFHAAVDGAAAYNEAARRYFGEFAKLNAV